MKTGVAITAVVFCCATAVGAWAQLPSEPIQIGRGTPQFVFDRHLVDNIWAIRYKGQFVERVHHVPIKRPENPLSEFADDNPSYVTVFPDSDEKGEPLYQMYFQANRLVEENSDAKGRKYRTEIGYAESSDGVNWTKPALDFFPEKTGGKPNHYVIGFSGRPEVEVCAPLVVEGLPEADQRGYRVVLLYRAKGKGSSDVGGLRLAGSKDGVRFLPEDDQRIAHLGSDHHNAVCYDPVAKNYVLFCRAKQIYRAFGEEMIDTGASRRVATMRSPELWTDWLAGEARPTTLMVPDAKDAETARHFFYGMPTVRRHGIFWGFLEPFRMNDYIHTELATSRDGENWQRLPSRPKLIEYGAEGSWDDTMIFGSPNWLEIGNEWWFYYTGWDGPHGGTDRRGNVGVATCLRERLISLRGPQGGGVVCTRSLVWPGGDLWINAAAVAGVVTGESAITVRVSDARRKVIAGFDHADSILSGEDETRQRVSFKGGASLADLTGMTLRLEIFLRNTDLFSFGAE